MGLIRGLWRFRKTAGRVGGLRAIVSFATHAPQYLQLFLRLLKDPRVPGLPKAMVFGILFFAISPLNLPEWIPVVGALDDLGLALFAISFFMKRVPADVLAEHRQAIGLQDSLGSA